MEIGKNAVVIGNVAAILRVGEGSVVIGATDANGNTILNQPMAVGRGAQAGPGSIAIGAYAGAGLAQGRALDDDLNEFAEIVVAAQDAALARAFDELKTEIRIGPTNKSKVMLAWRGVSSLATIDGAHGLLDRISRGLISTFG